MLDLAVTLLDRHGAGRRRATIDVHLREIATLTREAARLEGAIPWWEQGDGARGEDARRLAHVQGELERERAELAAARAAIAEAAIRASSEMPPLDVALRVARCLDRVADESIPSSDLTGPTSSLLGELESLAARVFEIWAPGFSAEAAMRELSDPDRVAALAGTARGPVTRHPTWGFAPLAPEDLVAHAARALSAPEVAAARAALARETAEHAAATARLRERRRALRWTHLVVPDVEGRAGVAQALADVDRETHELFTAAESLQHATASAFGVLPPLRIAFAAWAAAGALRARLLGWEVRIHRQTGAAAFSVGRRQRGLLLAALAALLDVTDATFPGLVAIFVPPREADLATEAAAAPANPYRQSGRREPEAAGPPSASQAEVAVLARARAMGLDHRLGAMLAHASMLGLLRRRDGELEAERRFLDVLRGDGGAREAAATRAGWHRAAIHALLDTAQATVAAARAGHFIFDLNAQLLRMQSAIRAIRTAPGTVMAWNTCPLEGKPEALAELERTAALLHAAFGDPGDRVQLAMDVAARIAATSSSAVPATPPRRLSRADVVDAIAQVLRPTRFAACHAEATGAWATHVAAQSRADEAKAAVTFWDVVNVFSDSDAERDAERYASLAQTSLQSSAAAFHEMGRLFAEACRSYPPVALLYGLQDLAVVIRAIRVRSEHPPRAFSSRTPSRICVIYGADIALNHAAAWARDARLAFGEAPSDVDLMVHHWAARLTPRPVAR